MLKENKVRICEKLERLRKGIDEQTDNSMAWFVVEGKLDKDSMLRMKISQIKVDI